MSIWSAKYKRSQKWWVIYFHHLSSMTENKTSRGWIFTIHNYSQEQLQKLKVFADDPRCVGISAGLEICPKTDTPHIQGYVRLWDGPKKGPTKQGKFRKLIGPNAKGMKNWFMTAACADWTKNAKYTQKDENVIIVKVPAAGHQGARTDLVEFRNAMKRRAPDEELFEDHLQCLAKYPRLEQRLKASYAKQRSREFRTVKGVLLWGPAGTDKSKRALYDGALKRLHDTYNVMDSSNLKWFNDYDGEKTIVINEMSGAKCKFTRWLEIVDGHQMQIETKGGHTYAEWTTVFMTSNKDPDTWWEGITRATHPEFNRRLSSINGEDP